MTTTGTPPLQWFDAGFEHQRARARAFAVLKDVADTIGPHHTTSVGLDHSYAIRVQFGPAQFDEAVAMAEFWAAGEPRVIDAGDQRHHTWSFRVRDVEASIIAVTLDGSGEPT